MTVTVSIGLLFGGAVYVLCKYASLKYWHAAVCILCGFYLASTSFAPYISQLTENISRAL